MEERTRVTLDHETKPKSPAEIADFLSQWKGDPKKEFLRFAVNPEFTKADLRKMIKLPFELSITEKMGKLALLTGMRGEIRDEKDRMAKSRLNFHTHMYRDALPEDDQMNDPSYGDIAAMFNSDVRKICVLATHDGLTLYRLPASPYDTLTKVEELIIQEGQARWPEIPISDLTDLNVLSNIERKKIIRTVWEKIGVIVKRESWDDPSTEILDIINLKGPSES